MLIHNQRTGKKTSKSYLVRDSLGVLLVEVDLCQSQLLPPLALLHPVGQPLFPAFNLLLGEGQVDAVVVLRVVVLKFDPMACHVGKVLLRLFRGRSTQTLKEIHETHSLNKFCTATVPNIVNKKCYSNSQKSNDRVYLCST